MPQWWQCVNKARKKIIIIAQIVCQSVKILPSRTRKLLLIFSRLFFMSFLLSPHKTFFPMTSTRSAS